MNSPWSPAVGMHEQRSPWWVERAQQVTKFNMDMEDDNEGSAPRPRGPVGGPSAQSGTVVNDG